MKSQNGFTLIELLIAMVLDLFILAGLPFLFMGNQHVYRSEEAAARLQGNARFALEILNREARKTGDKAAFISRTAAFPVIAGAFAAGQVIASTDTSLSLRYQGSGTGGGDGWIRDCLDANVAGADRATVTLFITAQSELPCTSDNATTGADPQTQALIGGIQALRFTYGEDTDSDAYADAYVAADAVLFYQWVLLYQHKHQMPLDIDIKPLLRAV